VKFFTACGGVSFCRMAGDDSHPARFAFIEFETLTAAQIAMTLNGAMLLDRPIKYVSVEFPILLFGVDNLIGSTTQKIQL
jgi:RNA recognition motif-containing protein